MKFDVLTDPGHGWIKVPKKLLAELGIADKITPYSYMRGDFAYLEEDADASTFFEAMKAAGKTIEQRVRSSDKSSRVRNYCSYRSPTNV